jgi:ATP synthase, subunit C
MADKYIYAVARVRALEMALFSQTTIEQLISQKNYQDCIQFLIEKGWGDSDASAQDAETILNRELEKTWALMKEMVSDTEAFDVLLIQDSFHNLKAAIKTVVDGEVQANVFYDNAAVSGETLIEIIKNKDFSSLPENMRDCAAEAYECLVHTGDGQMCDVIIDRAALQAMMEATKKNGDALLKEYAETVVAVADIKIAVRSVKTQKGMEFMKRAMAPCTSINIERLAKAALSGMQDVIHYLEETPYAGGAAALSDSSSAFERWCDNRIIETIRPQKYNSFTIGPLVAYILARQNEIKTVRIVLTGKLNHLSDEAIRERVREMYV